MASQGLLKGAPVYSTLAGLSVSLALWFKMPQYPKSCIFHAQKTNTTVMVLPSPAASSGCSLTSLDHGLSVFVSYPGKTWLQAGVSEDWGIPFSDSLYFNLGSSLFNKFVFVQNGLFNGWGLALRISFLLSHHKAECFFLTVIASFFSMLLGLIV